LLTNSKWTFDAEQFQMSFGICKIVVWVLQFSKSSLLYIEVWKRRCWLLAHQKKSSLKLDQITNDLLPDLVIVQWMINFKSIPSMEEHLCWHNCCSCTIADKNRVVGIMVVHFVQLSFFNSLQQIRIQWLQIHFNASCF
jgi:hypothetical protein